MIKITDREEELARQLNIFQNNATRTIDGVLIGLEMGIQYINTHFNHKCPSLAVIKDLLFDTKVAITSFKLEIAEDFSAISIKNGANQISNCSERELIYGISSFERNVALCFERLKLESTKHEGLCINAQKEINRIILNYINS